MFDTFLHKYLRVPYGLHVHSLRKASRPRATVLFLHGIGSAGAAWDDVVKGLPKDVNVIAVDLLGFGSSPSPAWAAYDAKTQARSVIATLLRLNIPRRVILVGHSMGALVAVEVAKRYPLLVTSLVLCSPPFYDDTEKSVLLPNRNRALKKLYRLIRRHPERFAAIAALAVKYKLVESAINVTNENVGTYMTALEASIINQTSLTDAKNLQKPMVILHGALDPVVIKKNLDAIVSANKKAELHVIYLAGHSLLGPYITALSKVIAKTLPRPAAPAHNKNIKKGVHEQKL